MIRLFGKSEFDVGRDAETESDAVQSTNLIYTVISIAAIGFGILGLFGFLG